MLATETMMAHPATALPGVALAQPTIQGTQGNAQPMQHAPHAAPNAHIVAPVVEQPQAGHTPPQQAVLAKAQHIVSQYHASHPNLQHAQGARPHLQMPHQALAGSPVATNQPQPGAGQGRLQFYKQHHVLGCCSDNVWSMLNKLVSSVVKHCNCSSVARPASDTWCTTCGTESHSEPGCASSSSSAKYPTSPCR